MLILAAAVLAGRSQLKRAGIFVCLSLSPNVQDMRLVYLSCLILVFHFSFLLSFFYFNYL